MLKRWRGNMVKNNTRGPRTCMHRKELKKKYVYIYGWEKERKDSKS